VTIIELTQRIFKKECFFRHRRTHRMMFWTRSLLFTDGIRHIHKPMHAQGASTVAGVFIDNTKLGEEFFCCGSMSLNEIQKPTFAVVQAFAGQLQRS